MRQVELMLTCRLKSQEKYFEVPRIPYLVSGLLKETWIHNARCALGDIANKPLPWPVNPPSKKWYKDPLKVAALFAGVFTGGLLLTTTVPGMIVAQKSFALALAAGETVAGAAAAAGGFLAKAGGFLSTSVGGLVSKVAGSAAGAALTGGINKVMGDVFGKDKPVVSPETLTDNAPGNVAPVMQQGKNIWPVVLAGGAVLSAFLV